MNSRSRVLEELVGIVMFWRDKPTGPRRILYAASSATTLFYLIVVCPALAQPPQASIHFDKQPRVFRIDAAIDAAYVSYVIGVSEKQQVQTLYWTSA